MAQFYNGKIEAGVEKIVINLTKKEYLLDQKHIKFINSGKRPTKAEYSKIFNSIFSKDYEKEVKKLLNDFHNLNAKDLEDQFEKAGIDPIKAKVAISTKNIDKLLEEYPKKVQELETSSYLKLNKAINENDVLMAELTKELNAGLVNETAYYQKISFLAKDVVDTFVTDAENKIMDAAGRRFTLHAWTQRAVRTQIGQDLLANTIDLMDQYGHDTVFVSYLSDSSMLCLPYQNKIYSKSGNSRYKKLAPALWSNGGGLLHPNCRHKIEPYFKGITQLDEDKPLSDKKITNNSNLRAEYLKSANQRNDYARKAGIARKAGDKERAAYYKRKQDEWARRTESLPIPQDSAFEYLTYVDYNFY